MEVIKVCQKCKIRFKPTCKNPRLARFCSKCKKTPTNLLWMRHDPINEYKLRKCLRCDKEFASTGNRLCTACNERNKEIEEMYSLGS
jgi:hypothetical protein